MKFSRLMILGLLILQSVSLYAAERHAFIVGNGDYSDSPLGELLNPRKDADDMAVTLRQLGYRIYSGGALFDLDNDRFGNELRLFADQLPRDATALVYYAGHGVGYNGDNYLIPTKSKIQFEGQLADRAVSLKSIVDLLKDRPGDTLNVILLDACRDNPLQKRGGGGGLSAISNIPRGTFIGYAAEPGKTAVDGNGQGNGVYTGELLKILQSDSGPSEPIEAIHKKVAKNVYDETGGAQLPSYESLLLGEYCIAMCKAIVDKKPPPDLRLEQKKTDPPKETEKRHINPWMALLGAVVVGALLSSSGGGSEGPGDTFTVLLDPPTQ